MGHELSRKALLLCAIVSSLLYAAMIWMIRYEGYDPISQVPSELTAIGAPTQPLWARLGSIYTALIAAFGFGVWRSAGSNRSVRIVAGVILAYAALGLLWPFAQMHQREVLASGGATLSDTLHVVLGAVTVFLMFLAIGFGATAFGKQFGVYSIVAIVVLLTFGVLTFLAAPRLQSNLPTPWIGLWERINISVFLLWVGVFAAMLLPRACSQDIEGRATFVATYDALLKRWPVPYEEVDVATRFGRTHVIVAGPTDAPPLVLLHGYMATSVMWAPNITEFSRNHRVYAIDIIGQPSKSVPEEPIRATTDYVAWLTATLDGLHLGRVTLLGMSFGGWLALKYAIATPERIQQLVLLSPGGLLPMLRQFAVRGMLMTFFPSRLTVNWFMKWVGLANANGEWDASAFLSLMYLGVKNFPTADDTLRTNAAAANALSDDELRSLRMPVLLLFGDGEVIYDSAEAVARARRLIPDLQSELIPGCRHEMCSSQHRIVDARVLAFLESRHAPPTAERRSVA